LDKEFESLNAHRIVNPQACEQNLVPLLVPLRTVILFFLVRLSAMWIDLALAKRTP
jgi:hypothetical protein